MFFFAQRIVIKLYNTNQRNAQVYRLMCNFLYLLYVSNIVGSTSEIQLCVQYGKLTCIRASSVVVGECVRVEHTHLSTRFLSRMYVNLPYCIHNCIPEVEPTRFETCRRHRKLNINLYNCVFRWFVLYISDICYCVSSPLSSVIIGCYSRLPPPLFFPL
jgi:hypothetical protein